MSTIDLIILGILLKSPKNAFELARFIDERQVGRLIKISKPAVYKACKRLFKAGFLDGEKVKEGEMPSKVIYTINAKGKDRFHELMKHFSENLNPFYFEFNSFIWNIHNLESSEGLTMLKKLESELKSILSWVREHEKEIPADAGFAARAIVKQYRMLLTTLVTWIGETIADFKNQFQTG